VLVFLVLVNVSRRVLGVTESGRTAAALCSSVALALCFALHPLTTEAVCVATFREDLLVALFTLSSLLVLDRALDKERRAPALIAIGFLQLLAVTSKESGIALAPAAIVYWLTFCRRESRLFAAGLAAVCGVVIGVFVFVRFTMGPATTQVYQKAGSLAPTLAEWLPVQTRIWMQQVRCVVDTRQLSIWYPLESIRTAPAIGSLLVVGGVVSACLLTAWKLPQSRFGLVLIAAAMLPVSNLAPLYVPIADRFLYLPLAGAALAAGGSALALAVKFSSARSLWILTTAVLVVLPFLATATVRREAVFATSVKLWQDAESKYPGSIHVARSLAVFHLLAGDYAEAARRFELVVKRQPLMWDHAGLAIAAYERGDRASAKAHLAEAVKLDTSLRSIDTLPSGSLVRILGVQRVAAMLDEFGLR
jgi:tetratricopeptide (TPR) repeat protein